MRYPEVHLCLLSALGYIVGGGCGRRRWRVEGMEEENPIGSQTNKLYYFK